MIPTQPVQNMLEKVIEIALTSDLKWDEAIAAIGIACKAIALMASLHNDGDAVDCCAHAYKRWNEGFCQTIEVTND